MLAIPDNQPEGIASAISITGSGTVAHIKVNVEIEHTYIGDLKVVLESPTGKQAVLHAMLGRGADNLVEIYDSASPGMLSAMVGQPMQGVWILHVADQLRRDVGTFKSWRIELEAAPSDMVLG
jgi:subtilisin-like proprotein convertase family protein